MSRLSDKFDSKGGSTAIQGGVTIISLLFKSALDAHLTHILQKDKKLSTHKALETYYNDIWDLADTLAETYMGVHAITKLSTEATSAIDNPLTYFGSLYSTIEKERVSIKETFLQNQIDEVQQLISHTLYRLKYIQD